MVLIGKDKIGRTPWQIMSMAQNKFPMEEDGSPCTAFTLDIKTNNPAIPVQVRDISVVGDDIILSTPTFDSETNTIPHNFRIFRANEKIPIYMKGQEIYPFLGSIVFKGEQLYVFEYFFMSNIQTPGGSNVVQLSGKN